MVKSIVNFLLGFKQDFNLENQDLLSNVVLNLPKAIELLTKQSENSEESQATSSSTGISQTFDSDKEDTDDCRLLEIGLPISGTSRNRSLSIQKSVPVTKGTERVKCRVCPEKGCGFIQLLKSGNAILDHYRKYHEDVKCKGYDSLTYTRQEYEDKKARWISLTRQKTREKRESKRNVTLSLKRPMEYTSGEEVPENKRRRIEVPGAQDKMKNSEGTENLQVMTEQDKQENESWKAVEAMVSAETLDQRLQRNLRNHISDLVQGVGLKSIKEPVGQQEGQEEEREEDRESDTEPDIEKPGKEGP